MLKFQKNIIIFFCLIVGTNSFSQKFQSIVFSMANGLPSSYVHSIGRYNNGYLWIGTSLGLIKYDGYAMKILNSTDSATENFFTCQFMDSNGNLWFGHKNGVISILKNGKMQTAYTPHEVSGKICAITENISNHSIYYGNINGQIIRNQNNKFAIIDQKTTSQINKICCYKNILYFTGNDGFYTYNVKDGKTVKILSASINDFAIDEQNEIIYYCGDNGLFKFSIQNSISEKINLCSRLITNQCDLLFLKGNDLWVVHKEIGISQITFQNGKVVATEIYTAQSGIPLLNITSIFIDDENIMWLGTYGNGLLKIERSVFNVIQTGFIKEMNISAIFSDSSKTIWIGSGKNLYKTTLVELETNNIKKVAQLKSDITCISENKNNELMVGTFESGLGIMNKTNQQIKYADTEHGFFSNKINHIFIDKKGIQWISSADNGIIRIHGINQKIFNTSNGLTHNLINSCFSDLKGRLWLSTCRTALTCMDIKSEKFTILKPENINFGLEINGITEDKTGNIWLATKENGLIKYDNNKFHFAGQEQGLLSEFCYNIFITAQEQLWVTHKNGFSVFSPSAFKAIAFNTVDNFPPGTTSANAFIALQDNILLSGSENNLVKINTTLLDTTNLPKPFVEITGLWISGEEKKLEQNMSLPFERYTIDFAFTGISLKQGKAVRYSYKLEGLDESWSEYTEQTKQRFSKLNYGTYTFKVKVLNNLNMSCTKPAEFSFTIRKPFYLQAWFILLCILIIIVGPFGYYKYRISKINKDRIILTQKVKERTIELEAQKENLKDALETLQATQKQLVESEKMASLGNLVAGIAHEINTPVGIGVMVSTNLTERLKKLNELIAENKLRKADLESFMAMANESGELLYKNMNRASKLINSFKKISVDQTSESVRNFNVKNYIEDIVNSLQPELKQPDIKVAIEGDEELSITSYPGVYAQILTNFIMNSKIHGFLDQCNGNIRIQFEMQSDKFVLNYFDSGIGISPENISKIFDPFFTTNLQKGSGLGLHIIYNLITQKLKGTISCESEEGRGVHFTVSIPKSELINNKT